ncbi:MAG: hypothetical protein SF187_19535 [Deltaproteobacteria bacterium]|nr:hypothetical protein [Deltaproteobacteria bacterium]
MKFAWLFSLVVGVGCGQAQTGAVSPDEEMNAGGEQGVGGQAEEPEPQGGSKGDVPSPSPVDAGELDSSRADLATRLDNDEPPVSGAKPLFFGGGSNARYGVSSDGKSWRSFGSGNGGEAADLVRGVGYGNGVFIGVGGAFGNGYVVRTTDGVNFTFPKPNTGWLGDVAFDHGVWVAAGGNGARARSIDGGKTWTPVGDFVGGHFRRMAAGGGLFLAVGHDSGGNGMTSVSSDGLKWSQPRSGGGAEWRGAAFGNGVFVLASRSACQVTADGVAFSDCGVPGSDRGAFFINGEFVLFRAGRFDHSPDAKTWTLSTMGGVPGSAEDRGAASGNGLTVGIGGGQAFVGPTLAKMLRVGGAGFGDLTFGWVLP